MKPRVAGELVQRPAGWVALAWHRTQGLPPQASHAAVRPTHQGEQGPLQPVRRGELQGRAPPDQLHQLQHQVGQAKGHQQLGHMAQVAYTAQHGTLKQRRRCPHRQWRKHQRGTKAQCAGHRTAHVGPKHVEACVGKVEHLPTDSVPGSARR